MKHEVKVVTLGPVVPIVGTDTLGVTTIDGYTVVVKRDAWREGDRGVYIEPDFIVPEAPWSAALGTHRRIRVKKLRGVWSQGFLVSLGAAGLPLDLPAGTDVMAQLGIERYEPFVDTGGAEDAPAPSGLATVPAYDLESWRKHRDVLDPDELVVVTEKLHGESARFVWDGAAFHLGSRTRWKRADGDSSWARACRGDPWIETWCRAHPGLMLYGEVYGNVPAMAYGVRAGQRAFRAFDVRVDGAWASWDAFCALVPAEGRVPVLFEGPASQVTAALAEGASRLGTHVREGFVLKPRVERTHPALGRVALKCVGNAFYEKGV